VALLFAGSPSATIGNPIQAVQDELGVCFVGGDCAQAPALGTVAGVVTSSTGGAIAGASVSLDSGQSTTTSASGSYSIGGVPAGTRSVTASAAGFASQSQSALVSDGQTTTVDFVLAPLAAGGPAIVDCITYSSSGGPNSDRHLAIAVAIVDDLGIPVVGANVTVAFTQNGGPFGTPSSTTDAAGIARFEAKNSANACYQADVLAVEAAGLAFDGSEPANGFTKGTDGTLDADCRSGSDPCGVSSSGASSPSSPARLEAIERAILVKRAHEPLILLLPSVVGVGVGLTDDARPAIQVLLAEENPQTRALLPTDISGTPVRVLVTGPFVAY
jgi:hypothetical protein